MITHDNEDEIRGPMKQATLFPAPKDLVPDLRPGIKNWFAAR
jgi:hypothetical protein